MKNKIYLLFPGLIVLSVLVGLLLLSPNLKQLDGVSEQNSTFDYSQKTSTNRSDTLSEFSLTPTPSPNATEKDLGSMKVIFSFMGDILLDSHVRTLIDQMGTRHILSDVKQVLSSSDVSMANFESPISERGIKENDKLYTFRVKPQNLKVLTEGGINLVALSNNHILDFGAEALLDTFSNLKDNNIRYAGAGENIYAAYAPVYFEIKGVRSAFLSSSHVIPFVAWHAGPNKPGVSSTYDPSRILSEIVKAKSKADIVVVYLHWGEEKSPMPVSYQKNLARMYIDKGADIVIGSHPHVLQGLEFYKGKIIAYSLGNFIFTNQNMETMILNVEIKEKEISKVQIIPCKIDNFRPVLIRDKSQTIQFFNKLKNISFGVQINSEGIVTSKEK